MKNWKKKNKNEEEYENSEEKWKEDENGGWKTKKKYQSGKKWNEKQKSNVKKREKTIPAKFRGRPTLAKLSTSPGVIVTSERHAHGTGTSLHITHLKLKFGWRFHAVGMTFARHVHDVCVP